MADIQDFRNHLTQIKEAIIDAAPKIVFGMAAAAKALAERNTLDKGTGDEYSDGRIPLWFLKGKELNARGSAYIEAKQKKDQKNTHVQDGVKYYPEDAGGNWKEFRQAQGLPIDHVTRYYTGRMWQNMQPREVERQGDLFVCFLTATNREDQNKMNWNRERYGDFVGRALGSKDREDITDYAKEELSLVIKNVPK